MHIKYLAPILTKYLGLNVKKVLVR